MHTVMHAIKSLNMPALAPGGKWVATYILWQVVGAVGVEGLLANREALIGVSNDSLQHSKRRE